MPKAHKNQGRIFGILRGWGGVNLLSGAKLEGGVGAFVTPPQSTNHLDWQGKSFGLAGQ
jgi:hypothetical protein